MKNPASIIQETVAALLVIVVCLSLPSLCGLPKWTLGLFGLPAVLYLRWRLEEWPRTRRNTVRWMVEAALLMLFLSLWIGFVPRDYSWLLFASLVVFSMRSCFIRWKMVQVVASRTLALLLLLTLPAAVQAQFTFTTNNGALTVTGYTGPGGDVIIPDTTNGLPVTSIGDSAFALSTTLTSITIPNSVTSLGGAAFSTCRSLTNITIGNSVTSISHWAFYGCSSLPSVAIPNSVTSIGYQAFYHCTNLTSITIPNSVSAASSQMPPPSVGGLRRPGPLRYNSVLCADAGCFTVTLAACRIAHPARGYPRRVAVTAPVRRHPSRQPPLRRKGAKCDSHQPGLLAP